MEVKGGDGVRALTSPAHCGGNFSLLAAVVRLSYGIIGLYPLAAVSKHGCGCRKCSLTLTYSSSTDT